MQSRFKRENACHHLTFHIRSASGKEIIAAEGGVKWITLPFLDRIDRLEVLLHQGQYKVEPFMVDEIALRLARFMVAG